jgi:CHAD domain-containing protein
VIATVDNDSQKPAPGARPPRFSYLIEGSMPASRAVAMILDTLLKIVIENQEGVIGRHDEEFLHDYRVAVRRTRSALSLFDEVVPADTSRRGQRIFSDLGRRTNAARDLDVLIHELAQYAEKLPNTHAAGLTALRGEIERRIGREYAAIGRWLKSKSYRLSLESWRGDIALLAAQSATAEGVSIAELAAEAIARAGSKAFRQAEKLDGKNPDQAIHRMRIRFKRLRYALEFSRSLSSGQEIAEFIVALKQLQDELGAYQDVVVHQEWMARLARASQVDVKLARAGEWLIAEAGHRRDQLRGEIHDGVPDLITRLCLALEVTLGSLAGPPKSVGSG